MALILESFGLAAYHVCHARPVLPSTGTCSAVSLSLQQNI